MGHGSWRLYQQGRRQSRPCKWVFRNKTNPDGSVDKYKARLVAKGFSQRKGEDYDQTFSPVAKLGTIRALLSLAAEKNMHMTTFDVSTAFLYGCLDDEIYMKQPEGLWPDLWPNPDKIQTTSQL